jgi:hypothetical protein
VTDITTHNGHTHVPPVQYRDLDKTNPREQTGVKEIIEEIQNAYDRQCRELDSRDNLIELLRDELAKVTTERDAYMRKTFEMAQQMKAVAQLCEEGRRLVDIVEKG